MDNTADGLLDKKLHLAAPHALRWQSGAFVPSWVLLRTVLRLTEANLAKASEQFPVFLLVQVPFCPPDSDLVAGTYHLFPACLEQVFPDRLCTQNLFYLVEGYRRLGMERVEDESTRNRRRLDMVEELQNCLRQEAKETSACCLTGVDS